MRAKDVLLTRSRNSTGTVVFVSHDRYFIDKLATRVFEVDDGAVHVFPGNYEDYLWRKEGGGPRRSPLRKRPCRLPSKQHRQPAGAARIHAGGRPSA